jgi:hypothetical protein
MTVKVREGWYDISVPLKQGMSYFLPDRMPRDPASAEINAAGFTGSAPVKSMVFVGGC